jgi:hypothetical protein
LRTKDHRPEPHASQQHFVLGGIPPLTRGGFDALSEPYYECRADTRMKMAVLRSFLRPRAPDISMAALTTFLTSTPKGPEKFATILSREAKQLLAMAGMNIGRCCGENLRFGLLMRRAGWLIDCN